jgi:hypothetical protein
VLLGELYELLDSLDESTELELELLTELGVSALLELEESRELEDVEYSQELSLKSGDSLLVEELLGSVELLELEESRELVDVENETSEIEV